jgi:hypothetical protein
MRLGWALLWLFCLGIAQEQTTLRRLEEVVSLIEQAQRQVVLVAPGLYNPALASALHKVAVERGVQVLLLLELDSINQPSSYAAAFGFLAPERPLYVRAVRAVRLSPRILLDSRVLISGPLVMGDTLSSEPTRLSTRFTDLAVEIDRFNRVWQQAPPCRPTAYLLGEQLVLRCRF